MRRLVVLLFFAVLSVACETSPAEDSSGNFCANEIMPTEFSGVEELQRATTGAVTLLRGPDLGRTILCLPEYRDATGRSDHGKMAQLFIGFYNVPFRLADPRNEWVIKTIQQDDLGYHQVRLAQKIEGLTVVDAELIVQFDASDRINFVHGFYALTASSLSLKPLLSDRQVQEMLKAAEGPKSQVSEGVLCIFSPRDISCCCILKASSALATLLSSKSFSI